MMKKKSSDKFERVMQAIVPHMTNHPPKVILAQVLIALRVEGIIGAEPTDEDIKKITVIRDAILANPQKKQEALQQVQQLLA